MSITGEEDQVTFREGQNKTQIEIFDDVEYSISSPFSIVWTPLPLITWILPFIGHTGITE